MHGFEIVANLRRYEVWSSVWLHHSILSVCPAGSAGAMKGPRGEDGPAWQHYTLLAHVWQCSGNAPLDLDT
jgi:hypothetical protein